MLNKRISYCDLSIGSQTYLVRCVSGTFDDIESIKICKKSYEKK